MLSLQFVWVRIKDEQKPATKEPSWEGLSCSSFPPDRINTLTPYNELRVVRMVV